MRLMPEIDNTKKVYLIVHGRRDLLNSIKDLLCAKFKRENIEPASLERAGSEGEYVAMIWPPGSPSEVIVSRIAGKTSSGMGMGAWASVKQDELFRLPLNKP